jgi:hypothetical protein
MKEHAILSILMVGILASWFIADAIGKRNREARPIHSWRLTLTRPDGVIQEEWFFRSEYKPRIEPLRGGQMQATVYCERGGVKEVSIAPAGWQFSCKRIANQ